MAELGTWHLSVSSREKVLGNAPWGRTSLVPEPVPPKMGARRMPALEDVVRCRSVVPAGAQEPLWALLLSLLALQKCRRDEASWEQAAAPRPDEPVQMAGR